MRLLLFSIALFLGVVTKAQTTDHLKEFINKNEIAIKSVHKNIIAQNLNSYSVSLKEILIQQENAVKAFDTNKNASSAFAYSVRKTCLEFLKKNYKGSTEYYEITTEEQNTFGKHKISSEKFLSETEIKAVETLDVMNFQSISNLMLTIQ